MGKEKYYCKMCGAKMTKAKRNEGMCDICGTTDYCSVCLGSYATDLSKNKGICPDCDNLTE